MTQSWAQATALKALKPAISVLDRRIERRARKVLNEDGTGTDLRTQVIELRSEVERMRAGQFAVDLLLGAQGRRNSRLISQAALRELSEQITRMTGEKDAYGRIVQAYRMLFELELRGVGRLAGGARNVLGKLAATPLLKPPNGEVLEIGTLFGLFSGGMARQINRIGLEYQLTIVDPLAEVQLQAKNLKPDSSGSPVTETVVRANLTLAGVDPARLRLVKGFSGDVDVQAEISDRQYGVVIIDGDHSAEGVAIDLKLAEKITATDGIVVLDDYGDRGWPGVEEAVGKHLAGTTRFELIGVAATSAFLRAHAPIS
jgi:predicted O-methyltransferase YrrM